MRKNKKIDRLIRAKLENRLSSEQEAELDSLLAGDENARRHYAHLLSLESHLQQTEVADVPVDVSGNVMQQISASRQQARANAVPLHNFLLRYAALLVAGIVIGAALMWLWLGYAPTTDNSRLMGAMSGAAGGELNFEQAGTSIRMVPYVIGNMYYLNFFTDSNREMLVEILYNDQAYVPVKSEFLTAAGMHASDLTDGNIRFSSQGKNAFQVILDKKSTAAVPVTVRVYHQQSLITSKQVFTH